MGRIVAQWACVFAVSLLAGVAEAQTPVGTAFTYQGQLKKNGLPINGLVDLHVIMWDASVGGAAAGTLITTREAVNGLIEFWIDFGDAPFDGSARWLEVRVRHPSGVGLYTILEPRQELRPTPYAIALPGLRTEQNDTSPNLIGGYAGNSVGPDVVGATIGGGGARVEMGPPMVNHVADDFGTVSGGFGNRAGDYEQGTFAAQGATVGGGTNNYAGGAQATVAGGGFNSAGAASATIGGGWGNTASAAHATVGGGDSNRAMDSHATVGGGVENEASAEDSTVSGGGYNFARGRAATVGGGATNQAGREGGADFDAYATVSGGSRNAAHAWAATVSGGYENAALGGMSTVPGGWSNLAGGQYSLAAGQRARVRAASDVGGDDTDGDEGTFVWSDSTTPQTDYFTSTGPNQFLIRASGGVGIGTNEPANALSVVGTADFSGRVGIGTTTPGATFPSAKLEVSGGHIAIANSHGVFSSTSAGGAIGAGFDTGTDDALDLWAGGSNKLRITPDGDVGIGTTGPASRLHSVDTQAGSLTYPLRLTNAGGSSDTAVGMLFQVDEGANRGKGAIVYERNGSWNRGDFHILQNMDSGTGVADLDDAVMTIKNAGWIGMGTVAPAAQLDVTSENTTWTGVNIKNLASDQRYLIQVNGTQPGATRAGNLEIWGTGSGGNHNVFTAAPNGNVGIRTQTPGHPLQVGTDGTAGNGAHVTAGGVWTNGSDRESKCGFAEIDKRAILAKVAALTVSKWRYKNEDDGIRHIGPVAQEFYGAFGLGGSDKHIGTVDADGVALAAIQGLHEMVKERDSEIETLRKESVSLRARLEQLEKALAELSATREGDAR